jgi:succinate dehydrogenase / fumarate reductase, cytochrome b subunit
MVPLKNMVNSAVGRKFVMAISGLALVGFIITHLGANLVLYAPDGESYNLYTFFLHEMGPLLTIAEFGLLAIFLIHIVLAVILTVGNRQARPQRYAAVKTKGHERSNLSSRSMAITGLVLFVFLIIHVYHFRFGPGVAEGYVAYVDGQEMRDMYRLVHETFQDPLFVVFYTAVMLFLGFHLRHGFWSAAQSVGMASPRWTRPIYLVSVISAILIAAGFLFIPIWFYLGGPEWLAATMSGATR